MSNLSNHDRDNMSASEFAFPKERKEPLNDARHVQQAVARFDQVEGVTNTERDAAWSRIQKAAHKFGVELQEQDWRDLFKKNGRKIPQDS